MVVIENSDWRFISTVVKLWIHVAIQCSSKKTITIIVIYIVLLKTDSLDNATIELCWLSHHGIWAIIPCSPNKVTVRVSSKLKTSWKSVVFANKVGKNFRYFVGVFNKRIISLALDGYEVIVAISYLTRTRAVTVKYLFVI